MTTIIGGLLMFKIALFEPEIAPNTGNIIRLCANTGISIHIIEPMSFTLEEKALRRAGLDYHEYANIQVYENFETFLKKNINNRIFAISTKGKKLYHQEQYKPEDIFLFGPETRGLPDNILKHCGEKIIRIPMQKNSRSLNLSNSAAIIAYEALRQFEFKGLI